jgi:hypothetical protein
MTILTEETKSDIIKTYEFLLDQQYEYNNYSDSDSDSEDASNRAKEKFEGDFEEYNNSTWTDPDSANYEQEKELIIDFFNRI